MKKLQFWRRKKNRDIYYAKYYGKGKGKGMASWGEKKLGVKEKN